MTRELAPTGLWVRRTMLLAGLAANALGVAVVTRANLGTSPIAAIPYALALVVPRLTLGEWTIVFGIALTVVQVLVDPSRPDWRQLGVQTVLGLVFGYAIDLFMPLAGLAGEGGYPRSFLALLVGCLVIAVGAFLEVLANLAMLPGDAFIRSVCRRTHVRFGRVRVVSDVSMSLVGAAVCWAFLHAAGSVREGTLVSALLVGLTVNALGRLWRGARRDAAGRAEKHVRAEEHTKETP